MSSGRQGEMLPLLVLLDGAHAPGVGAGLEEIFPFCSTCCASSGQGDLQSVPPPELINAAPP